METSHADLIANLGKSGWRIEFLPDRQPLPASVAERYPWLPTGYREAIERTKLVCTEDDKAWLLTGADFSSTSESAFAWNEWERQSLDAATGDDEWRKRIIAFWDRHAPVLMSVKSGYAYFAVQQDTLAIVCGEEPEYEETTLVASSIEELLARLARREPRLGRWV